VRAERDFRLMPRCLWIRTLWRFAFLHNTRYRVMTSARKLFFFVLLLLLPLGAHAQRVLYVDLNAAGNNDGTSWTDAFSSLQDALAEAIAGDETWVAAGIYHPDQGQVITLGDRAATFVLKDSVAIYGGFVGTETRREERDWEANETILSGDLLGNDNDNVERPEPTRSENSHTVVTARDLGSSTILDGLTITGGNANGDHPDNNAGGMLCVESNLHLRNITFARNSASIGGGLYLAGESPALDHVKFIENVVSEGIIGAQGGGLYMRSVRAHLKDLQFIDNTAIGWGGGLWSQDGEYLLEDALFAGNEAFSGGGFWHHQRNSNREDSTWIVNTAFIGNRAHQGGAAYHDEGILTYVNVIISGNVATSEGGGIFSNESKTSLINTVLYGNAAEERGGGYFDAAGDLLVANSVFWHNIAGAEGPQFYRPQSSSHTTSAGHSIFEGGLPPDVVDQDGNLTSDPLFVDADGPDNLPGTLDDDFRLLAGSPAIDAGDNTALPPDTFDLDRDGNTSEPLPLDYDGRVRLYDGGSGAAIVDIGAHEYGAPILHTHITVPQVPASPETFAVYPNPAVSQANIELGLFGPSFVRVVLYDVLGRRLRDLYAGLISGRIVLAVDVSGLPGGVYFVRVEGQGALLAKSLTVIH